MNVFIKISFFTTVLLGVFANAETPELSQVGIGSYSCAENLPALMHVAENKIYSWCPGGFKATASVQVIDPKTGEVSLTWFPKNGQHNWKDYDCDYFLPPSKSAKFLAFGCHSADDETKTATAIKSLDSSDGTNDIFEVGAIRAYLVHGSQFLSAMKNQLFLNEVSAGHVTSTLVASFAQNVDDVIVMKSDSEFLARIGTRLFFYDAKTLKQKWAYSLPLDSTPKELFWFGAAGRSQKLIVAYRTTIYGEYHLLSLHRQTGTKNAEKIWKYESPNSIGAPLIEPSTIQLSDDESVVAFGFSGYVFDTKNFKFLFEASQDEGVSSHYTFDPSTKTLVAYNIHQAEKKKSIRMYDVMTGSKKDISFVDDKIWENQSAEYSQYAFLLAPNYLVSVGDGVWASYLNK